MYKHILVGLDGSEFSRWAGEAALLLAAAQQARITACHVYGVAIHRSRFGDMEPGLPGRYRQKEVLTHLRNSHDRLMEEGFRSLSTGYVEEFVASARQRDIEVDSVALEGRSFVGILQLCQSRFCDLIALGAEGLGSIGRHLLGGTTTRVLYNAPCDVLVTRRTLGDGPILAGVDGSETALQAVDRSVALGRTLGKPVTLTAAYDPDFHTRVFRHIARSLTPRHQQEIGLMEQEKLHDDIINGGLETLYGDFLQDALRRCQSNGCSLTTKLVTGKAYQALDVQSRQIAADLIVMHRYGHHHESCSPMGSNTEAVLRITESNLLIVGGVRKMTVPTPSASCAAFHGTPSSALEWDPQAQDRLRRVPSFVRDMAQRAVENAVRQDGALRVTADDFDKVAARFGMNHRTTPS